MFKNKIDYKLINIAVFVFIIFLLYQTGHLWIGILGTILKIMFPFLFAFVVAYALHPILRFLINRRVPKGLGIFLILATLFGLIAIVVVLLVPLLFDQLGSLFNGIIAFIKEISLNYDLNFGALQDTLAKSFNEIIASIGKYVSNGAMNAINVSMSFVTTLIIAFSAAVYFLIDMDKIRAGFKKFLQRKSERSYFYVRRLDNEMKNYLSGFCKIMVISLIEYTVVYFAIGHPNALLLGFLAAISNLIPYFGGMITNIIAAITAFVISPALFIRTVISFFILSAVDGNVINPLVYGKSNQVHPIIVIMSVFAGGALFGIVGIIISLPTAIIILTTYHFFKDDIVEAIDDIKMTKKKD